MYKGIVLYIGPRPNTDAIHITWCIMRYPNQITLQKRTNIVFFLAKHFLYPNMYGVKTSRVTQVVKPFKTIKQKIRSRRPM